MYRVLNVMLAMLLGATTARASPWWVTWTGDAYPETEGWTHTASDPPAQRWLEDGKLFIDSRAALGMYDSYGQWRPGEMTLAPGETLHVDWALRVDETSGPWHVDPGVQISFDDQYTVVFVLGVGSIHSLYEPGNWAPFEPGVFHEFSFESSDMRTYALSVDGVPSLQGGFFESLFYSPGVGWGDTTTDRSLAEWDWVECGVVPEPSSILSVLLLSCVLRRAKRLPNRSIAESLEGDAT